MDRAVEAIFGKQDVELMRRPIDQAIAPPTDYYTSNELYELEVQRIFLKEWVWVGHVEHAKKPGDYFTFTLVGEPILVVRDQAGELRAFSNTCRHRGTVVAQGEGNCKAFTCPYHSWTYSLAGELVGVPGMEGVKGFDAAQLGLRPLRVEAWGGLVFVNFDPQAKPLLPALGDLPEYVKNYGLGETVCMRRTVYDYPCNWKLLVENAMEGYHILGTHATSTGSEYADLSRWSVVEKPKGIWEDLLFEGSEPLSMSVGGSVGKSAFIIDGLSESEEKVHHFILLYPDVLLIYQPDSVACFVMHPDGPASVKCYFDVHFPKSFLGRPGFEEMAKLSYEGTDEFNHQDIHLLALAQQGYRSRLAKPSRLSLHELIPYRLTQYVLDRLLNEAARPS